MRQISFLCLIPVVLTGCASLMGSSPQEEKWVEVGESAPAAAADASGFIVGKWGVKVGDIDPVFARQLGVQDIVAQQAEAEATQFYTFSQDGTFTYTEAKKKWVFGGRYALNGNTVNLSFETLDGEPIQKKLDEFRKGAEGGTQAGLGRDLYFDTLYTDLQKRTQLTITPGDKKIRFGGAPTLENLQSGSFTGGSLVRMKKDGA